MSHLLRSRTPSGRISLGQGDHGARCQSLVSLGLVHDDADHPPACSAPTSHENPSLLNLIEIRLDLVSGGEILAAFITDFGVRLLLARLGRRHTRVVEGA